MRISDWSSDVCSSDLSGEGQHYRIAGMNLLAAIIIFWNTMKLGEVVNTRAASGTHIEPDLLAHVSPLGWEHINLTGEYRWPKSLAKDSAPSRKRPKDRRASRKITGNRKTAV